MNQVVHPLSSIPHPSSFIPHPSALIFPTASPAPAGSPPCAADRRHRRHFVLRIAPRAIQHQSLLPCLVALLLFHPHHAAADQEQGQHIAHILFAGLIGQFIEKVQQHVVRRPMRPPGLLVGHLRLPPADRARRRALPGLGRVIAALSIPRLRKSVPSKTPRRGQIPAPLRCSFSPIARFHIP